MTVHQHAHDHDHGSEVSEMQLRVRALESILTEKGYVDPKALDFIVDAYETKIGPHIGAGIVAKAWADPDFKRRLLDDATAAVASLGVASGRAVHLVAVENTPQRHGCHVFPDAVVAARGEEPHWLYTVVFDGRELWGENGDPQGVRRSVGAVSRAGVSVQRRSPD
jgi:nitrile hydratase subunit alpha